MAPKVSRPLAFEPVLVCNHKFLGGKMNQSLAKFSGFISAMIAIGLIGLVGGGLFFVAGATAFEPVPIGFAVFLVYVSSSAIGLAVVGAFLRQTAKVIVEGLNGNLNESGFIAENISFTSGRAEPSVPSPPREPLSKEALTDLRSGWLSVGERGQWSAAGRPDLADWDGSIKFATWLKAQQDKKAAETGL